MRNSCERRRSADRSANKVFLSEARKAFATRHRARERGESNREWRVCGPPADACRAWSACGENAQSRKRNVGLFRASGWPQCFRQCSSGWETGSGGADVAGVAQLGHHAGISRLAVALGTPASLLPSPVRVPAGGSLCSFSADGLARPAAPPHHCVIIVFMSQIGECTLLLTVMRVIRPSIS